MVPPGVVPVLEVVRTRRHEKRMEGGRQRNGSWVLGQAGMDMGGLGIGIGRRRQAGRRIDRWRKDEVDLDEV